MGLAELLAKVNRGIWGNFTFAADSEPVLWFHMQYLEFRVQVKMLNLSIDQIMMKEGFIEVNRDGLYKSSWDLQAPWGTSSLRPEEARASWLTTASQTHKLYYSKSQGF